MEGVSRGLFETELVIEGGSLLRNGVSHDRSSADELNCACAPQESILKKGSSKSLAPMVPVDR